MTSASAAALEVSRTFRPAASASAQDERAVPQPHPDVEARVLEVQGMSMALGAETDDRDGSPLQHIGIGVLFVVLRGHACCLLDWLSVNPPPAAGGP